jgi:molybdopterin converting factor small subunit
MTVYYLLHLSQYTGCKCEQVSGTHSLQDLLRLLCERHGAPFRKHFLRSDAQDLSSDVNILVNGVCFNTVDRNTALLKDEDQLTFFPLIMGG